MKYTALALDQLPVVRQGDLSPEDLEELAQSSLTAWDIETSGLDFRLEQIGTVQIADDRGRSWLVKIQEERRPEILCALLADASKRKVFHFAPFDLGFMRFHWSVRAQNVACTKVLHRLVEPRAASHSLKDILKSQLGVAIDKDEALRRSDWNARELTSDQLLYAAGDVAYLLALYEALEERAIRQGVMRLAEQSFSYLPVRVETELLGIDDLFAY